MAHISQNQESTILEKTSCFYLPFVVFVLLGKQGRLNFAWSIFPSNVLVYDKAGFYGASDL